MSQQPPIRHFAILALRKAGTMRFLSHLDMARALERAARRADLPLKYSEGYNPSPQIGYASALPVGGAGERELCQIELERPMTADGVMTALSEQLPGDLGVVEVRTVSGRKRKHLSGLTRADYEIELREVDGLDLHDLRQAVSAALNAGKLVVVRETKSRTRQIDIRPGIFELQAIEPREDGRGLRLRMALALRQDSLVKPLEVVETVEDRVRGLTDREIALEPRVVRRLGMY